jgi:hypothetical protein
MLFFFIVASLFFIVFYCSITIFFRGHRIAVIILLFFIVFQPNPSFSVRGPTIILGHEPLRSRWL